MSKKRPKLTEYRLKKWYRLLEPAMTDFDCGQLCAPDNDGVPACCDHDQTIPLLFKEELRYHRKRSDFWHRYPRQTAQQRREAEEFDSKHDYACLCPGPAGCERAKRALVCRLYPFMPFLDGRGTLLGMTYIHGEARKCPLIDREGWTPPAEYVRGAVQYWREVFEVFPDERAVFVELGRKVRRRYRRLGQALPLFVSG